MGRVWVSPFPLTRRLRPRIVLPLLGLPLLQLGLPLPISRLLLMPMPPHVDPFDDPEDERFPLDPSAPPLSLDSARSEYRRMIKYICSLFPQASGVPPVDPPPRALFESFFAPIPPASQLWAFNWFE